MNGVIRKRNATFLGPFQNAHPKQNMNIAVDGADIAFRPACNLANSHRPLTGHQLKERPPFGRKGLPQKILRCERNARSLFLASKCGRSTSLGVTNRSYADCDGAHFRLLRLFTSAQKSVCRASRLVKM